MIDEQGKYQVLDGNHRFIGFLAANEAYQQYEKADQESKNKFLKILEVSTLNKPDSNQEVWVVKPDWSNNHNAHTRNYLRMGGFDI